MSSSKPPEDQAFELALRALNRRERTAAELGTWLGERGLAPTRRSTPLIERLIADGGRPRRRPLRPALHRRQTELAGWGEQRIRGSWKRTASPTALIETALADTDRSEELDRACALLAKRADPPTGDAARGRALAFLIRRGFPSELAYDAVRRAGNATEARQDGQGLQALRERRRRSTMPVAAQTAERHDLRLSRALETRH